MDERDQSPDPDRIPGLDDLAALGERHANPPPVARIRALGTRRRRRRHTAIGAGALAVTLVAGGVLVGGSSLLDTTRVPEPAQTPQVTVTPTRTVGPENVLPAAEVPIDDRTGEVIAHEEADRGLDTLSVCQQGSLADLGATDAELASYELVPVFGEWPEGHPQRDQPNLFTAAVQFDGADSATAAYETYRDWIDDCPAHLEAEGYQPKTDEDGEGLRPITWYDVDVEDAEAGFAEQIYWLPDESTMEDGYFEGVAVARSGDRLLIAVHWVYGPEFYWSPPGETDPSGAGPHPLEQLLPPAVDRLNR